VAVAAQYVGGSCEHGFLLPFPEYSQLLAKEQILGCQSGAAAPDIGEETQTVTDDRAQVPNEAGKPEDVEHPAIVSGQLTHFTR
jgi:hypothetical protein